METRTVTEPATRTRVLGRYQAPIRLDTDLAEQAVLLGIERAPERERRSFRAARDPLYELDAARRDASFQALHSRWFDRLGLAEALLSLLAEQPSIPGSIAACLVVPAARRRDEHADLREGRRHEEGAGSSAASRQGERPVLVIQLLAVTLIDAPALGRLLRRELIYVADMLDPVFGYDPAAAVQQTSGPLASLLRERHELLWRVIVDGRLAARGYLSEVEAEALRARFLSTLPMVGESGDATFRALFDGPRPDHRTLMQLARHPSGEGLGPGGQCPLCSMPAPRAQLEREILSDPAIKALRRDFASWQPADGVCTHCADLYDLRERARPTRAASR